MSQVNDKQEGTAFCQYQVQEDELVNILNPEGGMIVFTWYTDPAVDGYLVQYNPVTSAWETFGGGSGVQSVTGDGVDNTDPDNPVLTFPVASEIDFTPASGIAATDVQSAIVEAKTDAQAYADGLVTGLWDDRGNFDASVNAYPSSGGSGTAGAILKGDIWTISVAGTLPTGQVVEVGDTVRALVDTPGNTQANWAIAQQNIGYVAENSANKSTDVNADQASNTKYPSVKAVYDWAVALFAPIAKGVTNGDSHNHSGGDGGDITDGNLVLSDATANNSTTTKHGFLKKLSNVATEFMNGVGNWATPDASGITYTPAVLADWEGAADPGATDDALDQLALRVTDIEGVVTIPENGWVLATTWTRTGDYTFTVSGDLTAMYRPGTKVRYKDGGSFEYGIVLSSSYSAPNTTVTLITNSDYAMAAATITENYYSHIENPDGFPRSFSFSPVWTNLTVGNGTVVAELFATKNGVKGHIELTFGSTSSISGAVSFDAPAPPSGYGVFLRETIGICVFRDASPSKAYVGQVIFASSTTLGIRIQRADGTYASQDNISSTVPMTWTTSDILMCMFDYMW